MNDTQNLNTEATLKLSLVEFEVPAHLHSGLVRYIITGIPTGDFLRAVLSNDLILTACRADDDLTITELRALVRWVNSEAPSKCHGNHNKVQDWIQQKAAEFIGGRP